MVKIISPSLVPTEGRNTGHENSVAPYNPLVRKGLASNGNTWLDGTQGSQTSKTATGKLFAQQWILGRPRILMPRVPPFGRN